MNTSWKRESNGYYVNRFAGLEVWRGWSGYWEARTLRGNRRAIPARTMREAKIRAYELLA